jgi:hypothetical protein
MSSPKPSAPDGAQHTAVPKDPAAAAQQEPTNAPTIQDQDASGLERPGSLDLVSGLTRASSAANSVFDMTGQRVRPIVWCLDCGPPGRTGPAEMAAPYGRPRNRQCRIGARGVVCG